MCTLLAPPVWLLLGLLPPAPAVDDPNPPPPSRDEIDAAINVIEEHWRRNDLPEVERRLKALLDSLDPADDDNELARVWCLGSLGSLFLENDRPDEALPVVEQEVELRRALNGPDHAETANALRRLAAAHSLLDDYATAEILYRDALPKLEDAYGEDHLQVGETLVSFGTALIYTDQYDEAEQVLRRGLEIFEDEYGPDAPSLASILNQLGWLRYQEGDRDQSELFCRRAVDLATRDDTPPDTQLADYLTNLANALEDRPNSTPEVRQLRERALDFAEETYGPDHLEVVYAGCYLGRTLAHAGVYAKSEATYRQALNAYEAAALDDPGLLIALLSGLGSVSLYLDQPDEAELLWLRALAVQEDLYGPSHPEVVNTLQLLALLSDRRGNPDQADDYRSRAAEILEHLQEPPPPDIEPDIDF